MAETGNNLERWIQQQKEEYVRRLPEKLTEIERLLEQWCLRKDAGLLTEIIGIFHRIHGVAGSYDLDEIGEIAADCEEEVASSVSNQETVVRECLARIRKLLPGG